MYLIICLSLFIYVKGSEMVYNTNILEARCKQLMRMTHVHAVQETKKIVCNCLIANDTDGLKTIANVVGTSFYKEVITEINTTMNSIIN